MTSEARKQQIRAETRNRIKAETHVSNPGSVGLRLARGEGNTSTPPRARVSASLHWCFTFFPKTQEEIKFFIKVIEKKGKYFCAEEYTQQGQLHLQGFFSGKSKTRPNEWSPFPVHWEKCKGSWEQNLAYCSKEGNQFWTNMELPDPVIDPMEGLTLHWWQRCLINIIAHPADARTVHWWWEPVGGSGKTTFAKSLCMRDKHVLYVNGQAADVKYYIDVVLKQKITPRIIIFNFPRGSEKFIDYKAIEEVKDGIFFSTKYKSNCCIYNPPHIFCFANHPPDTSKLSKDRWSIINIGNETNLLQSSENVKYNFKDVNNDVYKQATKIISMGD